MNRSIGAYLRQQRQARGIQLAELEAITRIPRRSLERLEAGDFDTRPDGFSRGFVRTVAASLGLDPEDAVARMLEPVAAPERVPRRPPARALAALAALVAAAVVGAVLVWLASRVAVGEAPADQRALVYRRDAVRALAEEMKSPAGAAGEAQPSEAR